MGVFLWLVSKIIPLSRHCVLRGPTEREACVSKHTHVAHTHAYTHKPTYSSSSSAKFKRDQSPSLRLLGQGNAIIRVGGGRGAMNGGFGLKGVRNDNRVNICSKPIRQKLDNHLALRVDFSSISSAPLATNSVRHKSAPGSNHMLLLHFPHVYYPIT